MKSVNVGWDVVMWFARLVRCCISAFFGITYNIHIYSPRMTRLPLILRVSSWKLLGFHHWPRPFPGGALVVKALEAGGGNDIRILCLIGMWIIDNYSNDLKLWVGHVSCIILLDGCVRFWSFTCCWLNLHHVEETSIIWWVRFLNLSIKQHDKSGMAMCQIGTWRCASPIQMRFGVVSAEF